MRRPDGRTSGRSISRVDSGLSQYARTAQALTLYMYALTGSPGVHFPDKSL